jgi:O-antigen ligase
MHVLLDREHPDRTIVLAAALMLAGAVGMGLAINPALFFLALGGAVAFGALVLVWRFPAYCSVAWLLVAAASLEMTLNDLVGPALFTQTIAAVKGAGLVIALLCAVRFGVRADRANPAWAYLFMLATTLAFGRHPDLSVADSVRSFIGSVAPFAFAFVRLPRSWADAIIGTTKWCPLLVVTAAVPFALAGLRPLFVESGGLRLSGLGHAAFLANVCLPAIYASLMELLRRGGRLNLALLLANGAILVLTGARAPLAYATAVTLLTMLAVPAPMFPRATRTLLLLGAAVMLPAMLALAATFADIRIFNVTLNEATNLSGRDLLWPEFRDAAAQAPWFGWGVGAGNFIIPPTGIIARTLQTVAAHNEYLRMQVEGGQIGRGVLILSFVAWATLHTRHLCASDRVIMRLAFVAFGLLAITDNVLISTPTCVLFTFAAAVFVRTEPRTAQTEPRKAPAGASRQFALPDSPPRA